MIVMIMRNLLYWFLDYVYVAKQLLRSVLIPRNPFSYRMPGSKPLILLPGVYENWRFMQPMARYLFQQGYDVHVIDTLGYNVHSIEDTARLVVNYIETNDLSNVSIIAHSKGGLVGKFVMSLVPVPETVNGLIAINTPFAGSKYASFLPSKSLRMFIPNSRILLQLAKLIVPNKRIVSIYGMFDPHIPEGSSLDGARNIQIPSSYGHFRPLKNPAVLREVLESIKRMDADES